MINLDQTSVILTLTNKHLRFRVSVVVLHLSAQH